ncbi:MAG: proton-coupled thiamine transporter YuaJ [Lachnospiraceae bacterium]|nr:proton-coupled thiamine transporter YuaJ [Lachnospiraceae bacterium]
MSFFITASDGAYALTKAGMISIIILIVVAIVVAAIIAGYKQQTSGFTTKSLAVAGISLALAFVTSFIKFELPMGGSVTLFSMFFICYVGYLYGSAVGFITAFAYSLLAFIQSGSTYFLSPFQTCCDYFFAFTALGLAGLWFKKKHGLVIGYIVAVLVRGLFHTIGGYIYWMDYMPDWFREHHLASFYSIIYNYSYILAEMAITLIVINIPAVKKALMKIAQEATSDSKLSVHSTQKTASES